MALTEHRRVRRRHMVRTLLKRLKGKLENPKIDEPLLVLMQVAREDPAIKQTLIRILRQDDFHRASILNTTIEEMRLKGAPGPLISSFDRLLEKDVAERAYRLLMDGEPEWSP